jgi:hypothetical protein
MTKATTKAELIEQTRRERSKLLAAVRALTPDQFVAAPPAAWSPKDYVAHLAEWERLFIGWWECGQRGEKPAIPAEGYTWATEDKLNERIFQQFRNVPAAAVMADWDETFERFAGLVGSIDEETLFARGRLGWTGQGRLADYVNGCGANHYKWAGTEIRKLLKGA